MSEAYQLPHRVAREEELIADAIVRAAGTLQRACSSRQLDGLPLETKLSALQSVQDQLTELARHWEQG